MKATFIEPPPIYFEDCKNDVELRSLFTSQYLAAKRRLGVDATVFVDVIEKAKPYAPWKLLDYATLAEFVENELGQTLDEVEAIISGVNQLRAKGVTGPITQKAAVLACHGAPPGNRNAAKDRDENKGSVRTFVSRGETRAYILARLARDGRGDLVTKVESGALSARAAAREAGWVKDPNALAILRKAWEKATPEEREKFLSEVAK